MEEEQPAEGQEQAPEAQSGIGQLVQGIAGAMLKFREVMERAGADDGAKAQMDGIVDAFQQLISNLSGQGQPPPSPPQGPQGSVSMEGGVNGRPMGPQG